MNRTPQTRDSLAADIWRACDILRRDNNGGTTLICSVTPTEAETRCLLIDQQLARAGWDVSNRQQVTTELALR